MRYFYIIPILFFVIYIFGCTEKTTYSGKIITDKDLNNINISDKADLLNRFGEPSYIDNIQNKYFYYTEKNKVKNFYSEKKEYSYLFIFELDKDNKVIASKSIDLLKEDNNTFQKKETTNSIVKRGLIEKIFGGVGPQMPNSP